MFQCSDWKEIANYFLRSNSSLLVVMEAIVGCIRHISEHCSKKNNSSLMNIANYEDKVLDYISYLLEKYPKVLNFKDGNDYNRNLLHKLMDRSSTNQSCKLIAYFLRYSKDLLRHGDLNNKLPLHIYICAESKKPFTCFAIFNLLVSYYPESVSHIDFNGNSILHYQCPLSILSVVCQSHPKLLHHRNEDGKIPLHLAFPVFYDVVDFFLERVQILCNADPSTCQVRCEHQYDEEDYEYEYDEGFIALHFLLENTRIRISQCIEFLLRIYPAAVNIAGADGRTPYSLLLDNRHETPHPNFLRLVLRVNPSMDFDR